MKQTSIEWLEEEINQQQKRYIDLAKKDKSLKKGVDAILTATTMLKMKCKQAKELHKQEIIDAFVECWKANMPDGVECKLSAKQYYSETYNK